MRHSGWRMGSSFATSASTDAYHPGRRYEVWILGGALVGIRCWEFAPRRRIFGRAVVARENSRYRVNPALAACYRALREPAPAVGNRRVVVVSETHSLGSSLSDLLRSTGIRIETTTPLEAMEMLGPDMGTGRRSLIIAASTGFECLTARRWAQGAFPDSALIVVGSRDPTLRKIAGAKLVSLPITVEEFLDLVRASVR